MADKVPKSQSATKSPQVSWNDVHVRPFTWGDIDRMVDYIYRTPRETPYLRLLDSTKMPSESDYRQRLNEVASSFERSPWVTVEYKGQAVGVHYLNSVEGGRADFQAHIWNSALVGKGIGMTSWFKACQYFFENVTGLQRLEFRAPKDNPMALAGAKKLPFKSVGEEEYSHPFFRQPVVAKLYAITRAEFEALMASPEAEDEDESDL